jgi:BirA family biotin operon repressor/biotin-[acetyl-CoA-carboxylase] ligase
MNTNINPYESISNNLATRFVGQRVIYYPRLASTMDTARREVRRGAAEGTVIIAGEQTEGRGRMKRPWLSPRGNIALSIILYPEVSFLPYLVMVASLAVVRAVESVTDLKPRIKWPNDILIGGKKVCGILTESEVQGKRVCAIIGIGINVSLEPAGVAGISPVPASLNDESGSELSRVEVIRHVLTEFERLYLTLPDGEPVYEQWRDRLVTLGRKVSVASGNDMLEGVAESVDRSGALILRRADGTSTRIVAGDVTLRDD